MDRNARMARTHRQLCEDRLFVRGVASGTLRQMKAPQAWDFALSLARTGFGPALLTPSGEIVARWSDLQSFNCTPRVPAKYRDRGLR